VRIMRRSREDHERIMRRLREDHVRIMSGSKYFGTKIFKNELLIIN